jgi:hypothetical protein
MKLGAILFQIDSGDISLPEFQRGYVWNRAQVRDLMSSLYRKYPVGSLLVWVTPPGSAATRGPFLAKPWGSSRLLLDGQQRVTSLYGIARGKPPAFFEGDPRSFTNLHFHLEDENFEFYAPAKMGNDPLWVDVTNLLQSGPGPTISHIMELPALADRVPTYINRLTAITQITEVDLHIAEVLGEDKTVDVVVDIFNRVNSGGTKLSKGDLALARICADWPEARPQLRQLLLDWRQKGGFEFTLEWLLRVITTILTGRAAFEGLHKVSPEEFEDGLRRAEKAVNRLLNLVSARLGIDHDRVLGGRYAFPVMARFIATNPAAANDPEEQAKLLYWYVHSFIWGRFAGSTETLINQDLAALESGGLDELIAVLRQSRGDLTIRATDFSGSTLGARFYPLLYVLTRTQHSRDLAGVGLELREGLLGKLNHLEVHHIFPKALLYKNTYERGQVNAIANFCFLTQEANLEISNRDPGDYFAAAETKFPGALESQWIPLEPALRTAERYLDFLEARRELLAGAANTFLDRLLTSSVPGAAVPSTLEISPSVVVLDNGEDTLEADILNLVETYGLVKPTAPAVIANPTTGEEIGLADAAWLHGVQSAYDERVVLTVEPDPGDVQAMEVAGYRVFTNVPALRSFLANRALGAVAATDQDTDQSVGY